MTNHQPLSEERIASIKAGIAEAHEGRTRPANEVLAELGLNDEEDPLTAPWRVGTHYGIHVYAGDLPVATALTPVAAAMIVADHNARVEEIT